MFKRDRGSWGSNRLVACLMVFSALAVACSGDDGDDVATDDAGTQETTETTGSSETAQSDDPLAPRPLAERTSITIGWSNPVEVFLHVVLADARGEFERENLDVSFEVVPSNEQPLLLAQGTIDVSLSSLNAGLYNLIASGSEIKSVMTGALASPEAQEGFWARNEVVGDDGVQLEDLVDVPFTTSYGAGSATFGYVARAAEEMEPGVLTLEDMAFNLLGLADGVNALINGGVDIAQAVQPFTRQIAESGCCTYLEGLWPDYPTVAVLFGPNLLSENREAGEAFVRAVARTVDAYLQDDYRQNPEVAAEIAELLGQPEDVFLSQVTPQWDAFGLHPDFFEDSQSYFFEVEDVVGEEILSYDEPLALEDVMDFEFLEAAGVS